MEPGAPPASAEGCLGRPIVEFVSLLVASCLLAPLLSRLAEALRISSPEIPDAWPADEPGLLIDVAFDVLDPALDLPARVARGAGAGVTNSWGLPSLELDLCRVYLPETEAVLRKPPDVCAPPTWTILGDIASLG